jgi:hypothetical protein
MWVSSGSGYFFEDDESLLLVPDVLLVCGSSSSLDFSLKVPAQYIHVLSGVGECFVKSLQCQ